MKLMKLLRWVVFSRRMELVFMVELLTLSASGESPLFHMDCHASRIFLSGSSVVSRKMPPVPPLPTIVYLSTLMRLAVAGQVPSGLGVVWLLLVLFSLSRRNSILPESSIEMMTLGDT
ncbi:hypothetical protein D3C72_1973330 [compost metagenome]